MGAGVVEEQRILNDLSELIAFPRSRLRKHVIPIGRAT